VLSISKLTSGDARYYVDQAGERVDAAESIGDGVEEYYTGPSTEARGQWLGAGARELGLHGDVGGEQLRRVLDGLDGDGRLLRDSSSQVRVAGYDLTFSAPKSVSVLFGLGEPEVREAVRRAHDRAVLVAMGHVERLRNLGATNPRPYGGRRAIIETLGRSGIRASELCDLRLGDVRLSDGRFVIRDAETEAGVREVQMTPDLVDAFHQHLARLRAAGYPTDGTAFVFPNSRGNRSTRQRIGAIVREAAAAATQRLEGDGLPPLPETTPHTLRRTYISIALIANNFDVKWVMAQVGHADSKMTMDVYAQLEQRADRSHGPTSTPSYRAFPDFAVVSRRLRQTAAPVCLFAGPAHSCSRCGRRNAVAEPRGHGPPGPVVAGEEQAQVSRRSRISRCGRRGGRGRSGRRARRVARGRGRRASSSLG
jgi:hypothetical protein